MVVKRTSPDRSCMSSSGHEPSQGGPTLDGFGSRDLQVFAEAKPSIQLHSQVLNALFPLYFMFPDNDPRILEGSPVCDQQSLGLRFPKDLNFLQKLNRVKAKNSTNIIEQQPYSPDMAPADFFLFLKLKLRLRSTRLQSSV